MASGERFGLGGLREQGRVWVDLRNSGRHQYVLVVERPEGAGRKRTVQSFGNAQRPLALAHANRFAAAYSALVELGKAGLIPDAKAAERVLAPVGPEEVAKVAAAKFVRHHLHAGAGQGRLRRTLSSSSDQPWSSDESA